MSEVTLYVRPGNPDCDLVLQHLRERGIEPTVRDVTTDPSASAVLFGRVGRVVVPTTQVGERFVVGWDPLQLARVLPAPDDGAERGVVFGAAVRGVTAALAAERGLPWTYGVEVGPVREGSSAAAAGIATGDVVTHIGAYTLQGADQFMAAVAARRPGDAMTLTLRRRDGSDETVVVTFPGPDPDVDDAAPAAAEGQPDTAAH